MNLDLGDASPSDERVVHLKCPEFIKLLTLCSDNISERDLISCALSDLDYLPVINIKRSMSITPLVKGALSKLRSKERILLCFSNKIFHSLKRHR